MRKKLPKRREITSVLDLTVKDYSLNEIGLTQSLIKSFMECPRKFLYKINRIKMKSSKTSTVFGEIVHGVLDVVYTESNTSANLIDKAIDKVSETLTDAPPNELETIGAKAYAVLIEYCEFYKNDFTENKYGKPEEIFDIESGTDDIYARRRGKIDGQFCPRGSKENWLLERKTKGQINLDALISYLSMDFQSLYYTVAKEAMSGKPISGVLYDVIRNPGTNPHKNESLLDYIDRLREAIQLNPEHYFIRIEVPLGREDKERFKRELVRKVKDIFFKLQACDKSSPHEVFYRNQHACIDKFTCPYVEACTTNSLKSYYQDKHLFNELN